MDSLVGLSDVGVSDERPHCPICFELAPFAKGLENHLAHHLERLAMFALPTNAEEAAEDAASTPGAPGSQNIRERSFASGDSLGPPEFSDHGGPNSASSDKEAEPGSPQRTEPRQSETFDSTLPRQIVRLIDTTKQVRETYDKIKDIRGLPKAFQVVRKWLILVELTLQEALPLTKKVNATDDASTLGAYLYRCQERADSLQGMFEEMAQRLTEEYVPSVYQSIAARLNQRGAETLMLGIVGDLWGLATHPVFRTVKQAMAEPLRHAFLELEDVPSSLVESEETIVRMEETPRRDKPRKASEDVLAALEATNKRLEEELDIREKNRRREYEDLTKQIEREVRLVAEHRTAEEQEEKLAAAARAESARIEAGERVEKEAEAAAATRAAENAERVRRIEEMLAAAIGAERERIDAAKRAEEEAEAAAAEETKRRERLWAEAEASAAVAKKAAEDQKERLAAAVRAEQEKMKAVQRAEAEAKAATADKAAEEAEWWKKLEVEAKLAAKLATRQRLEEGLKAAGAAEAAAQAAAAAWEAEEEVLKDKSHKTFRDAGKRFKEAISKKEKPPIKFKDALGRTFSFPFHLCHTWQVSQPSLSPLFTPPNPPP